MTNQEKARVFVQAVDSGKDRQRCALLLMMLSIATGIDQEECMRRIRDMAAQ